MEESVFAVSIPCSLYHQFLSAATVEALRMHVRDLSSTLPTPFDDDALCAFCCTKPHTYADLLTQRILCRDFRGCAFLVQNYATVVRASRHLPSFWASSMPTPLHYAVLMNSPQCVHSLLCCSADQIVWNEWTLYLLQAKDVHGSTARDLAVTRNFHIIVETIDTALYTCLFCILKTIRWTTGVPIFEGFLELLLVFLVQRRIVD